MKSTTCSKRHSVFDKVVYSVQYCMIILTLFFKWKQKDLFTRENIIRFSSDFRQQEPAANFILLFVVFVPHHNHTKSIHLYQLHTHFSATYLFISANMIVSGFFRPYLVVNEFLTFIQSNHGRPKYRNSHYIQITHITYSFMAQRILA